MMQFIEMKLTEEKENLKIAVFGAGYVGLVTGVCLANVGNSVFCIDKDREKIESIMNGEIPIYEPGLKDLINNCCEKESLHFTVNATETIKSVSCCIIAVGTPRLEDGSADLRSVYEVALVIGKNMDSDMLVIDKSTVPPGTSYIVKSTIEKELLERGVQYTVNVASVPEFLKEGVAIADCASPDRIIIGASDNYTIDLVREIYAPFVSRSDRFIVMDPVSAEMTKYVANAMLASRISFMNEIAGICETVGADVNMVRRGIGSDKRIGDRFLYAGCGYGGSCFPKDISALIYTAKENGCQTRILEQIDAVNTYQKHLLADKVVKRFGKNLCGMKFAIWGVSFKPNTDDIREAPALVIIDDLLLYGANVTVYDPIAMENARIQYFGEKVSYSKSKYTALEGADALLLITEWGEFRSPDFEEMKKLLHNPVIFDGRNQYNHKTLYELGFEYYPVGYGSVINTSDV